MVRRNENFGRLAKNYLFVEIANRRNALLEKQKNGGVKNEPLISLGIGDTTEPIPSEAAEGICNKVKELSRRETYTGYPPYNGDAQLRAQLSEEFYDGLVSSEEVFISDGSKPDLGRLQYLFPSDTSIAIQDPVYPVYLDSAIISGKGRIELMPCLPANDFFPDLENTPKTDLIFLCSPNNPTGAVATREQLTALVKFAQKNGSFIIFDCAYREFITDPDVPKSIYEIPGADEVAMETGSFSKLAGFTGVRLGWTVCPKRLKFSSGASVWDDWARIMGTLFNGPSNLAESGAIALMTSEGLKSMKRLVDYYMENVKLLLPILEENKIRAYGGRNSPYLWLEVPDWQQGCIRKDESPSWAMFQSLLDECFIVCTPGVGFGAQGDRFVRLSMFAHTENVKIAAQRLKSYFQGKGIHRGA